MHIYGKENFQLAVSDSENELYIFKLNLRAKETMCIVSFTNTQYRAYLVLFDIDFLV